jgi:hypothetical protein
VVPEFFYNYLQKTFCLWPDAEKFISKESLGQTKYKIIIEIAGKHTLLDQVSIRTFETQQQYDVHQFYEDALNEKMPLCPWNELPVKKGAYKTAIQ